MVINHEIAYYLGFLAADGWVIDNRLGFALKREDKESVEYIANITSKLCGKNIEIKDYESKCSNGKYYPASRFVVWDIALVQWLGYFGIENRKSYLDNNFMENIPDEYKFAFIAGYFDGDGGITLNNDKAFYNIHITGRKIPMEEMAKFTGLNWRFRQVYDSETYVMKLYAQADILEWIDRYIELKVKYGIKLLRRKEELAIKLKAFLISRKETIINNKEKHIEKIKKECPICGRDMHDLAKLCRDCYITESRKHIPDRETLSDQLQNSNYSSIGTVYNVSANTVKNWAIGYGLYERKTESHIADNATVLASFLNTLSIKETAAETGLPDWKVTDILTKLTSGAYKTMLVTGKPVMNNAGMAFISAREATEVLDKPGSRGHIMSCTRGERRSAAGYMWKEISVKEYCEVARNNPNNGLYRAYNDLMQILYRLTN